MQLNIHSVTVIYNGIADGVPVPLPGPTYSAKDWSRLMGHGNMYGTSFQDNVSFSEFATPTTPASRSRGNSMTAEGRSDEIVDEIATLDQTAVQSTTVVVTTASSMSRSWADMADDDAIEPAVVQSPLTAAPQQTMASRLRSTVTVPARHAAVPARPTMPTTKIPVRPVPQSAKAAADDSGFVTVVKKAKGQKREYNNVKSMQGRKFFNSANGDDEKTFGPHRLCEKGFACQGVSEKIQRTCDVDTEVHYLCNMRHPAKNGVNHVPMMKSVCTYGSRYGDCVCTHRNCERDHLPPLPYLKFLILHAREERLNQPRMRILFEQYGLTEMLMKRVQPTDDVDSVDSVDSAAPSVDEFPPLTAQSQAQPQAPASAADTYEDVVDEIVVENDKQETTEKK